MHQRKERKGSAQKEKEKITRFRKKSRAMKFD